MRYWLKFGTWKGIYPPETPIQSVRYAVLDTEFTSLDRRSNRLLSVGVVTMEGARIRMGEHFYRVLNPGVEVPASTVVVHRLRQSDIELGEPPLQALAELREYIAGTVLVGHFIKMDVDLLCKEMQGTEHSLNSPAVDTARVHRWLLRNGRYTDDLFHRLEIQDLASLAKIYNIECHQAHHALDDAFVTARLWQKLIHQLESRGVRTLAALLKIAAP